MVAKKSSKKNKKKKLEETVRAERIWIKKSSHNNQIGYMCHISKNLYNEGNYIVRQEFINNDRWIRYNELWNIIKDKSENRKVLPYGSAQQVLMDLDKNWKSFFKAIKDWKRNPHKYLGRPRLPGYLRKNGEFVFKFTNQQCDIKDGYLRFPNKIGIEDTEVKVRNGIDDSNLCEVRFVPKGSGYWLEIVYEKDNKRAKRLDYSRCIGIDDGQRNFVAIADNIGGVPIVVKGGVLLSVNQYFNKEKAKLQSKYDKLNISNRTKRMSRLSNKRNRKISDFIHKTTRWIINYCIENRIGNIVIGHNEDWKQGYNHGKRNNQNFVSIPHNMLIEQLIYKGEEVGIRVHVINESHTSKCSYIDNEEVCHHDIYVGKRVKRGLFRSKHRILINADVNACYNMMRKAKAVLKGLLFACPDGIEDVGLHPVRLAIV